MGQRLTWKVRRSSLRSTLWHQVGENRGNLSLPRMQAASPQAAMRERPLRAAGLQPRQQSQDAP
jgi:hypothetical protein